MLSTYNYRQMKPCISRTHLLNTSLALLLIDTRVREVMRGLLNRVLIKLHINERKDVLIKSRGVHEAEILESDLNSGGKISEATKKMLEEKSHQISEAVRAALEQMMRRMIALRKENIGMIAEEIYNLLKERGELSISINCFNPKNPGQNSFPVLTQEFKR